ncbi:GNAT family N-acetyltransferase [Duganella violaceipulchra]|uniref:GNAT family N-acetyltransferase n=1 Tax=Duganella violaceipulchra TaxID=2849652 RepID=A0AA41HEW9_9BURK|nr:GNAT family N-acetyltransferase [Duganella violaceicalia]MBV6324830.1 GNAT family N-acetyltransferase [Duganella violaceicalia]MCP2012154.1 RimJ/RimL family protein N-acetyltransferase [Duganella violaceicalia]
MKILDTERLTLRTIGVDDAAFYYELVNDPTWLEFIGDKGIRSIEGARDAILEGPCAMQERLGHSLYVMERKSDGVALGLCGLIKRDGLDDVDIGYAIRPAWFGQGYTYEAAVAVVAYARDQLRMKRLLGLTAPANLNSIRLLQKLGLAFVELRNLPPHERPTNIYSIEFHD